MVNFSCSICGYFTYSSYYIEKHIRRTKECTGGKIIKITNICCEKEFKYSDYLYHRKEYHGENFKFKYNERCCNKLFKLDEYINHRHITHEEDYKDIQFVSYIQENSIQYDSIQDDSINNQLIDNFNFFMYILQEREFLKNNENVYKIGISKDIYARLGSYPKGSKIFCVIPLYQNIEKSCITKFKDIFIQRSDIGNEYFQGNINLMVNKLLEIISNTQTPIPYR